MPPSNTRSPSIVKNRMQDPGHFVFDGVIEFGPNAAIAPVPVATVGAEVTNVIPISIQIEDGEGNAVAGVYRLALQIKDGTTYLNELAAAFTLSDGGAGTVVAGEGDAGMLVDTDAAGLLELDLTDVAGASGATVFVEVRVVGYPSNDVFSATFD